MTTQPAALARLPVFADVDTGVDDAFALVYLLASADAELIGVASTGGNVDVDQVCRNNLGLFQVCAETGIPVSRGASEPLTTALRTAEDTHGPAGLGNPAFGAPNLTDADWLYGSDRASIESQIFNGRGGVMPAWGRRLSPETIKALAVYIHANAGGQ